MLNKHLFALLVISLFFIGCNDDKKHLEVKKTKQIDNSIIQLHAIDSNTTITLQKTKNGLLLKNDPKTLLIVDIFATWCPPCNAEAKVLGDIQKKFPNQVKIIGVTIEENIQNAKLEEFIKNNDAKYTFVNSPQNDTLIDTVTENLDMGKRFGIPLVVLYKEGKVFQYYTGATEEEFIISDIKQAIGK